MFGLTAAGGPGAIGRVVGVVRIVTCFKTQALLSIEERIMLQCLQCPLKDALYIYTMLARAGVCVCACVRLCVRARARARVCVCVRARACVCVCV